MSIQLLRDNVYKKCKIRLIDYDKLEDANKTKIHNEVRTGFGLELKKIISLFVVELSKHSLPDEKKKFVLNFKKLFGSKEFKGIFQHDIYYSDEYKEKCVEKCEIKDFRTTKSFLFENKNDLDEKSKDFYCVFLGKHGWNSWVEEFSPADFIISVEYNSTDNSIVQRHEIKNLPKELNSVPVLEIENYIPRVSFLEEIFNLFEQKNKKINITGVSGIGKTFLAKHFIQYYSENFSHIVWLNCSSGFLKAFTQDKGVPLLDIMGLISEYKSYTEGNMSEEGLMSMVLGRLRNIKSNSILVLDNINEEIYDYEDEIHLPTNWKILTTSKEQLEGFYNYIIPSFKEKATNLFYKYYFLEKDDDNLIRLLSAIEYHTLTIELLAKTAQQRQITIIDLIKRFTENGINVVEKARITSKHSKERRQTIENIEGYLNIIFDTSELSKDELKILLNIAIMQDEAISTELFADVYLSGSENKKEVDTLYAEIDILSKKGWISKIPNEVLLHNLIKEIFIKKEVNNESHYISSIEYLISCLNLYNFTDALKYFLLLENIANNIQNPSLSKYLVKPMSSFYNLLGLHHKSLELYSAYFPLDLKSLDFENFNNYAHRFKYLGNYDDALDCYYRIYNHFENQDPSMDYMFGFFESFCYVEREYEEEIADEMSNLLLGLVLFVENIYHIGEVYAINKASRKHKNAILFLKDALNHENTLIKGLEFYLKKREEYDIFSQETLDRCKDKYSLINIYLGKLHLCSKRYEMAFSFLEESLKIRERLYGQYSSELLFNYRMLFDLYVSTEDIENATEYLNKCIFICKKFPENHPEKVHQEMMKAQLHILNNSLSIKKRKELSSSVRKIMIQEIKHRLLLVFEIPDYVKEKGSELEEKFKILWIDYLLSEVSSVKEIISIPLLPLHEDHKTALNLQVRYFGIISVAFAEFKIYNEAIRYLKLTMELAKKHFPEDLIGSHISNISLAQLYISNGEFELANQSNKYGIDGLIDFLANNPTHSDIQMIKNSLNIAFENHNEIEKELNKYIKN